MIVNFVIVVGLNNTIESALETNKKKINKTKTILITVGIIVFVLLLVGVISVVLFIRALGKEIDEGIENIRDTIDSYDEKEEYKEDFFDSIPKELINRNLISNNLKLVANSYE